jgi:uncharacterized membrane protein YtjA (UPF0391 family)
VYFFPRASYLPVRYKRFGGMVRDLHQPFRAAEVAARGVGMLNWALIFFVIAVVAAIFGFSGIAVATAGIAKILFFLFLILFVVSLISGLTRRV